MEIGLDVVAVIGFFVAVGLLLLYDRKNIEFNYGLIIRRWKRGQYVMDKWIFSHRKFLEIVGTIGIVVGLIAAVVGLAAIIWLTTLNQQAVSPVLPTVGGFEYPAGVIGVPFWFWIVSIFVILTVHEPMHAIFARLAGVPVRSWGVMTFFVLPLGAFVDPDMKKVSRLSLSQKLRIFAGGSFGNFVTGAVVAVVLFVMASTMFVQVFVQSTIPNTPAAEAGVEGKLLSVNGIETRNVTELGMVLREVPAGSTVEVATESGTYQVVTAELPKGGEGSYLGLSFGTRMVVREAYSAWNDVIFTLYQLFYWLFIFNVGIGIFNMLPMKPFDGGHMFEAIFARFFGDKFARTAIHVTSFVVLGIILINVFGTNLIKALI